MTSTLPATSGRDDLYTGLHARSDVADLYGSSFVDRYDAGARIWERLVCTEALRAFDQQLKCLPRRPLTVLDLGCGTGRNLSRLHRAGIDIASYVGVDASARMLARARDNHPYTKASFELADVDDRLRRADRFDLVIATWLLSHHPDPRLLIARARSVLRTDGRLLMLVVTASTRISGRAHGWHFRRYLKSNPVDIDVLYMSSPRLLSISSAGRIAMAEFARSTTLQPRAVKAVRDADLAPSLRSHLITRNNAVGASSGVATGASVSARRPGDGLTRAIRRGR